MSSLRKSEIFKVDILGKSYEYLAWSNGDALKYNSIKEQIDADVSDGKIKKSISKYVYEKNIFDLMVKPNLILKDDEQEPKSSIINTILFLEMYIASRGIEIDVLYACPKCFDREKENYSSFKFSLTDDIIIKNKDFKDGKTLKTENVEWVMKTSDISIHDEVVENLDNIKTKEDEDMLSLRYLFSWIDFIVVDKEKRYPTLDGLIDFALNDLKEDEFADIVNQISNNMLTVSYKKEDIECEQCGSIHTFESHSLPDFSLLTL